MGSISGHSRPACIGRLDFYRTHNRFASKIMGLCLGYVARASTNLRGGSSSRPAGSSRSSLAHLVSSLRSPRFRPNRRHWRPPWVDLFVFTEARRILKGQPCGHASANRVLPHLQKLSSAFICHQWQLLADCSQSVRIHAAASKLSGVLCANTRGG